MRGVRLLLTGQAEEQGAPELAWVGGWGLEKGSGGKAAQEEVLRCRETNSMDAELLKVSVKGGMALGADARRNPG